MIATVRGDRVMKRREVNPGVSNLRASKHFGPLGPVKRERAEMPNGIRQTMIAAGFLAHRRSGMAAGDLKKNWMTLNAMERAKAHFVDRICQESLCSDPRVLEILAGETMQQFAQFYYAIHVMNLTAPNDILVLLDFHNERVASLAHSRLPPQRLAGAIFADADLVQLEDIWRDKPGALQQSALARFLAPQMAADAAHKVVAACDAAGLVTRIATVRHSVVVESTGVMEAATTQCLRDMRLSIPELYL
jgi:hypothetical protein